ncbi:restriction endonuclease subunit S [Halomonas sp. MC140]|nr:restriction endonuclease subunit S [Halomonas sp. MC140]MDN7132092.1 restriction endonuclease subunit S [Halomonas sp. MC140]
MSDQVAEVSATYLFEAAQNAVPVGYKQTEVGVIPRDWVAKKISELADVIRGASPRPKGDKRYYGGTVPRLMVEDVTRDGKFVTPTVDSLTEAGAKLSRPCPKGTLTLVCSGTVGIPSILAIDACIHDGFLGLVKISKKVSINYLYHFFSTQREKFNNSATHGGVFTNLTTEGVKEFLVALPTHIEEQFAIANALSDVDALISDLEKLIAKKQAIKTATMQQLLTGRTRLPQFALREDGTPKGYKQSELGEIPEDWEVAQIKDIGTVDPENLSSTTPPDYEFYYVSLEQVEVGKLSETIRCTFLSAPSRARRILRQGDILVSTVRPNLMSHFFIKEQVKDLICSTGFSVIRKITDKLFPNYLYQHLFSSVINNQIDMLITGSNYPAINSTDVNNLKIQLGSVEEQTAIATILSDMDEDIQTLEQRLGKTRQLKQGMMQELLTGKTRLVASAA